MGGNLLNSAVTMTTNTTASVSSTGNFVYKKTTSFITEKFKNNCTYLPLGGGMASQLKPDDLSLYNRGGGRKCYQMGHRQHLE